MFHQVLIERSPHSLRNAVLENDYKKGEQIRTRYHIESFMHKWKALVKRGDIQRQMFITSHLDLRRLKYSLWAACCNFQRIPKTAVYRECGGCNEILLFQLVLHHCSCQVVFSTNSRFCSLYHSLIFSYSYSRHFGFVVFR